MRTYKTCCCCGDKPCKDWDNEYRYNGGEANCPICALGTTTTSARDFEEFAPTAPEPNQGDSDWDWRDKASDGHPDGLHYGNLCWHPGEKDWEYYPEECEWNSCWTEYINDPTYSFHEKIIPKSTFYQYDSPMGLLPWSPQAFTDWIDNWEGPLLPKGDCTMHCTLGSGGNLGCHKLAFVGAIGKNFGSQHENTDGSGYFNGPLCGSDIVTVPPPESDWPEIREWVRSGGKLIVMGESSGSPMLGTECKEKIGFFNDSNYYTTKCLDGDDAEPLSGLQVAELLRNFALYCAQQEDEEEIEEFFRFRDDEYYDVERDENFINNFEVESVWWNLIDISTSSCCQRSKRPFLKRDTEDDPLKSFSFHCSSSSGLLPRGKGQGLVGHCNGEGCTVVWKPNGDGAVVVVYDSNVWGATNSQIPLSWWEQETYNTTMYEYGFDAETLKLRACNSDFWRFMCDDFLGGEMPTYSCTESDSYWDNKDPENYTSENPCLPTAPCCLPNGDCLDDVTVWECFEYEDENENRLPGIWWGPEAVHPSGIGSCDLTCGDIDCIEQDKKLCCSLDLGCSANPLTDITCCLSEDEGFTNDKPNLVYKYECCRLAQDAGFEPEDVEDMWTLTGDEYPDDTCKACYVTGACCDYPNFGECNNDVRKHECEKAVGQKNFHEDVSCESNANLCDPLGACCVETGDTCFEDFTESDCVALDGDWMGENSTCNDCEFDTGACCFEDGSCQDLTNIQCNNSGGNYEDDGVACADADCTQPPVYGACCIPGALENCESCQDLTDTQCEDAGGFWNSDLSCSSNPCDTSGCTEEFGACCVDISYGECGEQGECCCVGNVTIEECFTMGMQLGGTEIQPNSFHAEKDCSEVTCCGSCCCIDDVSSCLSTSYLWGQWSCLHFNHGENCNGTPSWNPCEDCFCDGVSGSEQVDCEGFGSCCISECFDVEDNTHPVSCVGHCKNVANEQECLDELKGPPPHPVVYYTQGSQCDVEGETSMCSTGYCCHSCIPDGGACSCQDCTFENECEASYDDNGWEGEWTAYDCSSGEPDDSCWENPTLCDPDALGGCCVGSAGCIELTQIACAKLEGTWLNGDACFGSGVDPNNYQCDLDKGTCCTTNLDGGVENCSGQGPDCNDAGCHCSGEWYCVWEYCVNDPLGPGGWFYNYTHEQTGEFDSCCCMCSSDITEGACCTDDCGSCHITNSTLCNNIGGTFHNGYLDCGFDNTPCGPWRGGCCAGSECIDNLTDVECEQLGSELDLYIWFPGVNDSPCSQCNDGNNTCSGDCCVWCSDCEDGGCFEPWTCVENTTPLGCDSIAEAECLQDGFFGGHRGVWYYDYWGGCTNCPLPLTPAPDAGTPDAGTPEIPQQTCPQECIDAGCKCNCLNTRNGIVCL